MTNPTRSRTRPLPLLVLSAAIVSITALVVFTGADDTVATEPAPEVAFEFFDGTTADLADFAGKPVVINFWASWCPACVAEMPDFAEVHARFGDRVAFIGMNMQEVSIDAAVALAERTGVEYPLAHDRDGAIFRAFGALAMPTTVFVDEAGGVARVFGGVLTAASLTAIIEDELLG